MKITDGDKFIIQKFANAVGCKWFEFSTDSYGDTCVLYRTTGRKLNLWEGLYELLLYNADVGYRLIEIPQQLEFINGDNDSIDIVDKSTNQIIIPNAGLERLMATYHNIDILNNLLTMEERQVCKDYFDKARVNIRLNRDKLHKILKTLIETIEKIEEFNFLETTICKKSGITRNEYNLIMSNKEKELLT